MNTSKTQKRNICAWIGIIAVLLVAFCVAVYVYEIRTNATPKVQYQGTYALGEQTDDDCIYVVVGDVIESGKQAVVIYRQQDEKHVKSGIAKRTENRLVLEKPKLVIEEKENGTRIQYGGYWYEADKISDTPTFAGSNAASNQYFKYYEK